VNLVVGFRPELWRAIDLTHAPAGVHGFNEPLRGADGYEMPATQADLFVWYAAAAYDIVFDLGKETLEALAPMATLARETTGWSYRHSRDLTGFEDGTENPNLYEAPGVALIDDGAPGAGGSVLLFQQWRHEAAAFGALSEGAQERVIGRTKLDSIELKDAAMPADSHVSRTTVVEDGTERPIFRRNVPYGNVSDHGTLFIGFSADQRRMHRMLEQMVGIDGGPRDALTRYSRPLTGAYYFVPSIQALARFTTQSEG
jgi:putative iron-dependent peroxidase